MDTVPSTSVPSPQAAPQRPRVWPYAVQSALFIAVISVIVGFVTHSLLHGNIQRPVPNVGELPLTPIDLNLATRAELQLLPGIGPSMAERIDAYRILHGPYASVDELRKVPGIGPKTLERLRPWLVVRGVPVARSAPPQDALEATQEPRMAPARAKLADVKLDELIDINTASAADLDRLPGIGPKLAQRIMNTRAAAPFQTVDELRRVPGIGPKTLEKVRPYVTIGASAIARED